MRSVLLPVLVCSSCCQADGPQRRLWGNAALIGTENEQPGDEVYDEDGAQDFVDKQLEGSTAEGGGFTFPNSFRPKGGFRTPVGEQAACILDKAARMMTFHVTCHQDHGKHHFCHTHFMGSVLKSLHKCCTGEEHIPLWGQMTSCNRRMRPAVKFMTQHKGMWRVCVTEARMKWVRGGRKGYPDFNTVTCLKAGELIPAIVKRLYAVSAELFVEAHRLDVTRLAKKMMITCDPGYCARMGCDKDGHELALQDLFSPVCTHMMRHMFKRRAKQLRKQRMGKLYGHHTN